MNHPWANKILKNNYNFKKNKMKKILKFCNAEMKFKDKPVMGPVLLRLIIILTGIYLFLRKIEGNLILFENEKEYIIL